MAALYGAALVGLIGAVTAVWGASGEPRTAAPAVAGGAAAQPVTARGADPSAVPGRPPAPRSPARSAGVVATHSHRPSASGAPSTSPATAVLPGLAAVDTTRVPPRATGTAAAGPARLTASYGYTLDEQTGYAGSIRLRNSGDAEAGDWTVRLTVPGGEQVLVTGGDVEVSQSGTDVTFRPSSPAGLDAGSSAGFTFTLDRVPARPPAGCTVNGTACT